MRTCAGEVNRSLTSGIGSRWGEGRSCGRSLRTAVGLDGLEGMSCTGASERSLRTAEGDLDGPWLAGASYVGGFSLDAWGTSPAVGAGMQVG